jgi:hypothetical protein
MPRDAIQFFNECLKASVGEENISAQNLIEAEGIYSSNRLRALQDEWYADYPNLIDVSLAFLGGYPKTFTFSDVNQDQFEEFVLDFAMAEKPSGKIQELIFEVLLEFAG